MNYLSNYISRRCFLKRALGSTATILLPKFTNCQPKNTEKESVKKLFYGGNNLEDFEYSLGDANYHCPDENKVIKKDLNKEDLDGYTELWSNINNRKVMAHNMSHLGTDKLKREGEIYDTDLIPFRHTFRFNFKLPYLPSKSNPKLNPQTIEGHMRLYDGRGKYNNKKERRLYGVGFQWILNPWVENHINVWEYDDWKKLKTKKPDQRWHEVQMVLSPLQEEIEVYFDEEPLKCRSVEDEVPEFFGRDMSAWVAAETINAYPNCDLDASFKHYSLFKDWEWEMERV